MSWTSDDEAELRRHISAMPAETIRNRIPGGLLKDMVKWSGEAVRCVADPEVLGAIEKMVAKRKREKDESTKDLFQQTAGPEFAPLRDRLEITLEQDIEDVDSDGDTVSVKSGVSHGERARVTLRIKLDGKGLIRADNKYTVSVSRHGTKTGLEDHGDDDPATFWIPDQEGIPSEEKWEKAVDAFYSNYIPFEDYPEKKKQRTE